jgi:hypothetical protein
MEQSEIIARKYAKVYEHFINDPKTPEGIEAYRRIYSKLTEKDLLKTFTI